MPTEALKTLLYRDLSKAAASEIIALASPLLQESVNYSTYALIRAFTSSSRTDEDLAVFALYRQVIEMTDGIEVLISASCPDPAIPLLRSCFEAMLSVEYILESEEDYTRRALAWLVGHITQRLKLYDRLDPETEAGKGFKESIEADKTLIGLELDFSREARAAKANLEPILDRPHIKPIYDEFRRCRRPRWYKLFDGPSNRRDLAKRLNRRGQYDFLYREWSKFSHAESLTPFLATLSDGQPAIEGLRNPGNIKVITNLSLNCIVEVTRLVLWKFRPGEEESFSRWYQREIKEGQAKLQ